MNALEAELLDRSMARLGGTLQRNREFDSAERARAVQAELERESLGLRRDELGERRADRDEAREDRATARSEMAKYHEAMLNARSDDDKFKVWNQIMTSGLATQETLDNMSKAMSEKMGVEVKLTLPKSPVRKNLTGNEADWELAKTLQDEIDAAQRSGAGDVAEERRAVRAQILRGMGRQEPMATITDDPGDPTISKPPSQTIRRPVPVSQLGGITNAPMTPGKMEGDVKNWQGGQSVFNSEEEARKAGKKAGDEIRLMINGKPTRVLLK